VSGPKANGDCSFEDQLREARNSRKKISMVSKNNSAPQNATDTNLYNPKPQGQTATSINNKSNVASPMDNKFDAQISGSQVQAAIPLIVESNVALPTMHTYVHIASNKRNHRQESNSSSSTVENAYLKNPNLTTNRELAAPSRNSMIPKQTNMK